MSQPSGTGIKPAVTLYHWDLPQVRTCLSQLVTQLDDLSPLYWDLCSQFDHISNIPRPQKYSAVMYYKICHPFRWEDKIIRLWLIGTLCISPAHPPESHRPRWHWEAARRTPSKTTKSLHHQPPSHSERSRSVRFREGQGHIARWGNEVVLFG